MGTIGKGNFGKTIFIKAGDLNTSMYDNHIGYGPVSDEKKLLFESTPNKDKQISKSYMMQKQISLGFGLKNSEGSDCDV